MDNNNGHGFNNWMDADKQRRKLAKKLSQQPRKLLEMLTEMGFLDKSAKRRDTPFFPTDKQRSLLIPRLLMLDYKRRKLDRSWKDHYDKFIKKRQYIDENGEVRWKVVDPKTDENRRELQIDEQWFEKEEVRLLVIRSWDTDEDDVKPITKVLGRVGEIDKDEVKLDEDEEIITIDKVVISDKIAHVSAPAKDISEAWGGIYLQVEDLVDDILSKKVEEYMDTAVKNDNGHSNLYEKYLTGELDV